jgi:CRP-like cAMP-binding protein
MVLAKAPPAYRNRLLSALPPADLELLRPNLEAVTLDLHRDLEKPNGQIGHVYFFEDGIASVVIIGPEGRSIEVGLIGSEGMSGVTVLLGNHRSPTATYMQVAGHGHRIRAADLRRAMKASVSLQQLLLKFAQAFMIQMAHTAACHGTARLDERLARWILMAQDRLGHAKVPVTHEFLALMLGVRRPRVTDALHILEGDGLIRASRGQIIVLDRRAIEKRAKHCYGIPEAEYRRLFGERPAR